jgi:galactose mutarotase-like enzyme
MISLQHGHLSATIHPLGAELRSLFDASTGIEYMWQADPAWWGKHSPVLFPIVGSLKNNAYFFEGREYHLPRHGFARDQMFLTEKLNDYEAVFTLTDNEHSRLVYPFAFRLQLIYTLTENDLSVTYRVHNPAESTLWFSVGGHPAFNIPLLAGTAYRDHYLQFNMQEPFVRWHLQDGLISDKNSVVEAASGRVPLHPSLFYEDAIVFKHLKSNRVTIGSIRHAHGLDFDFPGFPYLGIWAAKDAPFVCIEPWCGHADTIGHDGKLENKPGIERLEAGEDWERTWRVTVF